MVVYVFIRLHYMYSKKKLLGTRCFICLPKSSFHPKVRRIPRTLAQGHLVAKALDASICQPRCAESASNRHFLYNSHQGKVSPWQRSFFRFALLYFLETFKLFYFPSVLSSFLGDSNVYSEFHQLLLQCLRKPLRTMQDTPRQNMQHSWEYLQGTPKRTDISRHCY